MCVVVQWFVAWVVVMNDCVASKVCQVRARSTIILGCVRVIAVMGGMTETLGYSLSYSGALCFTG